MRAVKRHRSTGPEPTPEQLPQDLIDSQAIFKATYQHCPVRYQFIRLVVDKDLAAAKPNGKFKNDQAAYGSIKSVRARLIILKE